MVHHIDDNNGPKMGRRGFMQIAGALGAAAVTQPTAKVLAPSPVAAPTSMGPNVLATFNILPSEENAAAKYYPLRNVLENGDYGQLASKFFGKKRYWLTEKWEEGGGRGIEEFLDKHMDDIIDLARTQYENAVDEFSEEAFQRLIKAEKEELKELSSSVGDEEYDNGRNTENFQIAKSLLAISEGLFRDMFVQDVRMAAREDLRPENILSDVRKMLVRNGIPKDLADQVDIRISENNDELDDVVTYEFTGPLDLLRHIDEEYVAGAEVHSILREDGSEADLEQPTYLSDLNQEHIDKALATPRDQQAPAAPVDQFVKTEEPIAEPFRPMSMMRNILESAMSLERRLLKEVPDHTEKLGRLGRAASEALSDFFNDSLMRSRVHEHHREGKKDKPALELSQDLDLLFKQAATVPENPPLVYRLVDHGGEDLTGQVVDEPSYLSASASYEEALERAKKTDQHVMALQVSQGIPVLRRGSDVLLPRGTQMQVTEHDREGGIAHAILKHSGGLTNV